MVVHWPQVRVCLERQVKELSYQACCYSRHGWEGSLSVVWKTKRKRTDRKPEDQLGG